MDLSKEQLDTPTSGRNLPGPTLGAVTRGEPTLLVFLRHPG